MTELSDELERQALNPGHETSVVTIRLGEGIHVRESGEFPAAPLGDEPATTEEVAMPAMTASQTTATKYRPILVRLPFSPEPISPMVALSPPPDCRFTFEPGSWERLVVAAELDRESRGLPPAL